MNESSGRVDRPPGRPVMRFRWLHLLFAHWPVPVESLRSLVPPALEIDTFEGTAWVGLVPFTMRDVRHRWMSSIPTMRHFHECNVRTYVKRDGQAGVWFFSLDAASRMAVRGARRFWNLPYFSARMQLVREGDTVQYEVEREGCRDAFLRCTWRAEEQLPRSRPGELAHFLTERYMLYSIDRRGRVFRGRIWHDPWPLRSASLLRLDDHLIRAAGIAVEGKPALLLHADELSVDASPLKRA